MSISNDKTKRSGGPSTIPGTGRPGRRPGHFPQDLSRTPPTEKQREREYGKNPDDKMDEVLSDATPVGRQE